MFNVTVVLMFPYDILYVLCYLLFPLVFSLRMFNNEDVSIGSWMLAMNVHHEDNRAICDPRCTPTSIAVWDIPKCSGKTTFGMACCYVDVLEVEIRMFLSCQWFLVKIYFLVVVV